MTGFEPGSFFSGSDCATTTANKPSYLIGPIQHSVLFFRRVAAALPGMETSESSSKPDMTEVVLKDTPVPERQIESAGCTC